MVLQVATQVAQVASPIVAAIAATFAARSSAASRRAAEAAERAHERATDDLARQRRPNLGFRVEHNIRGRMVSHQVVVKNDDEENVARDVMLELARGRSETYREFLRVNRIGIGGVEYAKEGLEPLAVPDNDVDSDEAGVSAKVLRGRITFSDELGLGTWSQRFAIAELAERFSDGVRHVWRVTDVTVPQRSREIRTLKGTRRKRVTMAWRVLRGDPNEEQIG